jgi:thioredoxin-like negative regulator of GroEL
VNGLYEKYHGQVSLTRLNILNSDSQPMMDKLGFSATPEIYLLDPAGKIVALWDDLTSEQEMAAVIDAALAKQASH